MITMTQLLCVWDKSSTPASIRTIVRSRKFPLFIKKLAHKPQFWYACIWVGVFSQQFFDKHPNESLQNFFLYADHLMAIMPDLFNDKLIMQAHGLIWKYGFKMFYVNSQYVISILQQLSK